jgi:hypothetical protein
MWTGINLQEEKRYTLKQDAGQEGAAVFVLKPLTNRDKIRFMKFSSTLKITPEEVAAKTINPEELDKIYENNIEAVKCALKRIENFRTEETGEPKTITEITEKVLDMIPLEVIGELAAEIIKLNILNGKEIKN